jgi:hypothetical protein
MVVCRKRYHVVRLDDVVALARPLTQFLYIANCELPALVLYAARAL